VYALSVPLQDVEAFLSRRVNGLEWAAEEQAIVRDYRRGLLVEGRAGRREQEAN
jgi:hypothetical protein